LFDGQSNANLAWREKEMKVMKDVKNVGKCHSSRNQNHHLYILAKC